MQHQKAVLLLGHADPESFNHQLAAAYAAGFRKGGGHIKEFILSELDFDPVLRTGFRGAQALEPDLLLARTALEESAHHVWVFPTYWAAPPAIVRAFFDRVFLPGWAFQYEKGSALQKKLLKGKSARVLVTMDSPGWWYTLHYRRCLHRSFGTGSLSFCGIAPVRFSCVYNMLHLPEAERVRFLARAERSGQNDAGRLLRKRPVRA